MLLSALVVYVSGLSLTTLALLACCIACVVVARRKGYGVRLGLACVVLTALPGSRRFPNGVNVRVSTRILAFLVGGCRGPWLDLSADRFVMRLRAAPAPQRRPSDLRPVVAALLPLRRWFAAVSAALSVENGYWRIVAHNIAVHLAVFFLRGVRLRAERVHIWRKDAHWAFKADQFVYVGHAVGIFGSRYDLSVNELSVLADRYPAGVDPPPEPADSAHASSPTSPVASPPPPPPDAVVAAASADRARTAGGSNPDHSSNRFFATVPADFSDLPQPTLTPHSSHAAITTLPAPASLAEKLSAAARPAAANARATTPVANTPSITSGAPAPLRVSLVLRKGVHLSAHLTPRFGTVWRPRRMAIMDDIKLSLDVRDVSARTGDVFALKLDSAVVELCPGYSRSLRAKLPPSAPSTRRPRKPALLRYWECSGSLRGLNARLVPPQMPAPPYDACPRLSSLSPTPSTSSGEPAGGRSDTADAQDARGQLRASLTKGSGGGLFATVNIAKFEAFGMAADERQDATMKANLSVEHVYAGSIAVEASARAQCESLARFAPPSPQRRPKSPVRGHEDVSGSASEATRRSDGSISGVTRRSGSAVHSSAASDGGNNLDGKSDASESEPKTRGYRMRRFLHLGRRRSRRRELQNAGGAGDAPAEGVEQPDGSGGATGTVGPEGSGADSEQRATGSDTDNDSDESDDRPPPLERDVVRNLEAFLESRPEAILWLAGIGATYDMNCAKRDAVRLDLSGDGAVIAVEPSGLLRIVRNAFAFSRIYTVDPEDSWGALAASPLVSSPADSSSSVPLASLGGIQWATSPRECPLGPAVVNAGGYPGALSRADLGTEGTCATGVPCAAVEGLGLPPPQSALSRSCSLTSSVDGSALDTSDLLFACDLKRSHFVVLGDGPVGEGDTLALIFAAEVISVPRMIQSGVPGGGFRVEAKVSNLRVDHWTQWARTSNLVCDTGSFSNMSRTSEDRREISVHGLWADWDLDLQSAMEELPDRFRRLAKVNSDPVLQEFTRALRLLCAEGCVVQRASDISSGAGSMRGPQGLASFVAAHTTSSFDPDAAALAEVERRERRERRRQRFLQVLNTWVLVGTSVRLAASFPDGPRLVASAAEVPSFHLSDERYVARHVVVSLSGTRCMYCAELRVKNPIHSMGRLSPRRHFHVEVATFRAVLEDDYWFGLLLQDWIVRLKAVLKVSREARYRRRGLPMPRYRKKPFPDLHLTFSDCEISMVDKRVGAFLTQALPLMQDEALERERRYTALAEEVRSMEQSGTATEGIKRHLKAALDQQNSDIYVRRMKSHMAAVKRYEVAPGFLRPLEGPPIALFTAATISIDMIMDEATRTHGSPESIRKLRLYDEYLLGPMKEGKTRQYESSAWNAIGFRDLKVSAVGLRLRFRDFPAAFVSIDRLYLDKGAVIGQAQQATVAPYLTEATVAIGRRRVVKVVKSVASTKTFMDLHLIADVLQCTYNPAYFGSIVQFGRSFGRFLPGSKNPSPRMPWFDSIRNGMHGRMRITARTLKGTMSSSTSPYTETQHFVDIEADNFSWLLSRMPVTATDPSPISWEVQNWRIRPNRFRDDRQSGIILHRAKVCLDPVPTTLSGDPQDHYYFPFVTQEQVDAGAAGIGRAVMIPSRVSQPVHGRLNEAGHYTEWTSPLLTQGNPTYDSFTSFKTHAMHLGINIHVSHAPGVSRPSSAGSRVNGNFARVHPRVADHTGDVATFWAPRGSSVLHSDGVTTLMKVIGKLVKRPVSNRAPPRWLYPGRKPACPEGLGYRLLSLDLNADISDLNLMIYNNFELQHGLFFSLRSGGGGLTKKSRRVPGRGPMSINGTVKLSEVVRRNLELRDFYVAMRVPGLEFADRRTSCGYLFSLESLSLSSFQDQEVGKAAEPGPRGIGMRVDASGWADPAVGRWDKGEPLSYQSATSQRSFPRVLSAGYGGNDDTSPFYTFSSKHPMQRGKRLDKVDYKQVLAIDGIRMLWSPMRRNSLLTWPDAFVEKSFSMKGAGVGDSAAHDPLADCIARSQVVEYPVSPKVRLAPTSVSEAQMAISGPESRTSFAQPAKPVEVCGSPGSNRRSPQPREGHRVVVEDKDSAMKASTRVDGRREGASKSLGESGAVAHPALEVASTNDMEKTDSLRTSAAIERGSTSAALRASSDGTLDGGDLIDLIDPVANEALLRRASRGAHQRGTHGASRGRVSIDSQKAGSVASDGSLSKRGAPTRNGDETGTLRNSHLVNRAKTVLETDAKFQLLVTDSQVCFGSPDSDAIVVLTSEAASVGFVDKTIEQAHQLGGRKEKWVEAEHRIHLQRSRLYSQAENTIAFNFERRWIPKKADSIEDVNELSDIISPLTRVTVRPISFNVMYILSKSVAKDDDQDSVDHVLRPAQLFINVPQVSMDSTRVEFLAVVDIVRKVLMQRVPNSDVMKDELALLRYNMQLAGGRLSTRELQDYSRQLRNITMQFLYAGETFQEHLVRNFLRIEDGDFRANYVRYKARAKAVAAQILADERSSTASSLLFPTMYVSYSFDECSWKLRDLKTRKPFVELLLNDLVCRHVFYVARGLTSEFTFGNISAINHQEGGFYKHFLEPATNSISPGSRVPLSSKIKASDGTSVAFRCFTIQMDNVGGIPVYDVLTINVSPLNAAISSSLFKAVMEFAFGTSEFSEVKNMASGRKSENTGGGSGGTSSSLSGMRGGGPSAGHDGEVIVTRQGSQDPYAVPSGASATSAQTGNASTSVAGSSGTHASRKSSRSAGNRKSGEHNASSRGVSAGSGMLSTVVAPLHARSRSQDVQEMNQRGQSTMIFKYIYIGEFQLTASYRQKEDPEAHSVLDISDLTVETPSYMYSSKVWTWRDFARQVRKDLLMSFAFRGVSNLAKIKLLPGYQRARRRIRQGTDTVSGLRHGLFDRGTGRASLAGSIEYDPEYAREMDVVFPESVSDDEANDHLERVLSGEDSVPDINLAGVPGSPSGDPSDNDESLRRQKVLEALFGAQGSRSSSSSYSALQSHGGTNSFSTSGAGPPSATSTAVVTTGRPPVRSSMRRGLRSSLRRYR